MIYFQITIIFPSFKIINLFFLSFPKLTFEKFIAFQFQFITQIIIADFYNLQSFFQFMLLTLQ